MTIGGTGGLAVLASGLEGFGIHGAAGQNGLWSSSYNVGTSGSGGSGPLGAGGMAFPPMQTGFSQPGSGFGAGGSGMLGIGQASAPGASGSPGRAIITLHYTKI